jgi:hypothetical protein
MPRPVVGIYASLAPVSWGPWVDRPSLLAPATLGDAVQRAGAMAVLLAPGPEPERPELPGMLDALIVFDDADFLDGLVGAARARGLAVLVLDAARLTPASSIEDFAGEIAGLLAAEA